MGGESAEQPFARRTPDYYEATLNPDKKLPRVKITPLPVTTKGTLIPTPFSVADEEDNQIGSFTLNISRPPHGESSAYLNTIGLEEQARGKGYGKATYLEILKYLGETTLHSGFQLSRGSKPIWDWLVEKGVARIVNEGAVDESAKNAGYSSTEYVVI